MQLVEVKMLIRIWRMQRRYYTELKITSGSEIQMAFLIYFLFYLSVSMNNAHDKW